MGTELFIAAIVSLVVQVIKRYAGTNKIATLAILLGISLITAWMFQVIMMYGYWESVVRVVTGAAGIYAIFIKQTENYLNSSVVKQ